MPWIAPIQDVTAGIAGRQVAKYNSSVPTGNGMKWGTESGKNFNRKGIGNPVDILGRGSTGRTEPKNLQEQLAMHEVMSNPLENAVELKLKMGDTRWHSSEGWVKMEKKVSTSSGKNINIHYVYNKTTGEFDDFKFKSE